MKKFILLIISTVLLVSILTYASALANPATVYCEELGYDYQIKTDENGNQYGVCIPSNEVEYEEWAFLKGKVGKEYSYCEKNGYDLKTVNENGNEYAVCIVPEFKEIEASKNLGALGKEVPMEELMNLGDKVAARGSLQHRQSVSQDSEEGKKLISSFQQQRGSVSSTYNQINYSYWDWRNPPTSTQYASAKYAFFDTIRGWITSIKNQGNCGSCWSFSAHGSIEAKYNLEKNNSRLNPDLSEQHSVSCDKSSYLDEDQTGCDGGWMDVAMRFFMMNGTVDENCFSYTSGTTGNDGVCSNRCSDYQNRTWTIDSYTPTYQGMATIVYLTHNETKQWLIDNGPMSAGMYLEDDPEIGIYRCTDDSAEMNHGVVLIGYNDTGNITTSYWIIKNSWGTGSGIDGYFNLGFNECNFTSEFEFATNVTPPEFKPSITLNSPNDENKSYSNIVVFNFTVSNKVYQNSICDLIVDTTPVNTTVLAINGTSNTLSYNLSDGYHDWSITCWENGLGIENNSVTRSIRAGTPPDLTITLNSPLNDTFRNVNYNNFSFSAEGAYPISCTSVLNSSWTNDTHDYNISGPGEGPILYSYVDLSDGNYTWSVNCTDNDARFNESETRTFNIDTTYSVIDITYPQNTTYNTHTNSMNYTLTETNPSSCWFFNGTANNTIICGENITGNLSSAEGSNTWIIYANDSVGNQNSSSVTFFIDTITPVVHLITPANNTFQNTNTTIHTYNVTDDSGPANCTMYWMGNSWNFSSVPVNGSTQDALTVISSDGTISWYINCTDAVGNTGMSEIRNVTVDTVYPIIDFESDTITVGYHSQNWIYANVTVNETNFNRTTIYLYNQTGLLESVEELVARSLAYNFTNLSDGIYLFNATTYDLAGNINNTETRNVKLDTTPPVITINSPTNGSYYRRGIFNVSLNENGTCLYSIDDGANKSMSSTDNRNFNATNSSMSQIAYNLTFNCNDSLNHWNFTLSMFTFDSTSPVVTLISPSDDNDTYEEDDTVSFKYNVTDNFGIANCSLLIDEDTESTDITITNNTEQSISHSFSSSGDYNWIITCYDRAGNPDNSSERTIEIQAAADDDDDSGGGGGSSNDDPAVYKVSNTKLSQGYTKKIGIGDKLNFSIGNTYHILTLKSIKGKNATITIASTIQTITLEEGEEKNIDLTSDNSYDISVKLIDVTSSAANLTIKSITTTSSDINSSSNLTNSSLGSTETNDGWTNKSWRNKLINSFKQFFLETFSNKYFVISAGVLILVGIACLAWYIRMRIRRRKGWDK